ncbi:MAG: type II toxin-antitoxin system VapC family toxin [Verrucomicrobia bacterium]|nr:type II toxin-antitoxin system VapC family toxin [Verrucomicrobiota bacterium]MCH8526464.1 type II toxin-antitoxin system VapC family toxin [Kiritimatiellia bacterium]
MDLLLDTHVWIWAHESPDRLGEKTKARLMSSANRRIISSVSTLEIARLVTMDQYRIPCPLNTWIDNSARDLLLTFFDLDHASAREAYALQGDFHADPADRMLVATARVHNLTLLTADERILAYPHARHFDARL